MLAKPELEHFQWQPAVLKRCVFLSWHLLAPCLAMAMAMGAFPGCSAARFTLLIDVNQQEDSCPDIWAELCCAALQDVPLEEQASLINHRPFCTRRLLDGHFILWLQYFV